MKHQFINKATNTLFSLLHDAKLVCICEREEGEEERKEEEEEEEEGERTKNQEDK